MSTITSANAVFIITPRVAGIFPVPHQVQGFASDDAFATDTLDSAEARMGVDGRASFGYTPRLTKQSVTLQADSPSIPAFDILIGAQDAIREVIELDAVITMKATGAVYAFVRGVMTRLTPLPAAKKVLEPQAYEFTWETVQRSPGA